MIKPILLYDHKTKKVFAVDDTGSDGVFSSYFMFNNTVMDDGREAD